MALANIEEVLEDLRQGKVIVLIDDEDRENEGDFVVATEHINIELINFFTRIGGGYLCVAMTGEDCDRLELGPQVADNTSVRGTPFTISVDGHPRHNVTTGISAWDRVKTLELLVDENSRPDDFVRPGHINPLRARVGGVLARTGQTEGSVDLCKLAGLKPSAVIIEIVKEDGEMARVPDLEKICEDHNLKMCSVEQIIEYRLARESLVKRIEPSGGTPIETPYGTFNLIAYHSAIDAVPHLALTVGGVGELDQYGAAKLIEEPTLVRVHRRNLLGDIFDVTDHPSGKELRASLRMIAEAGSGALVYLRPEQYGDEFVDRLQKIQRPDSDVNVPDLTVAEKPMDRRDYGTGVQIIRDLGLKNLKLLTNHPKHLTALHGFGIDIAEEIPIETNGDR
ncbi:MAG: 3,4-dihydroxy-2-butanone-4-phosphate synthase [Phycisphaerales bacterium]|nr:3,4-dihydroxy-2-butanone-4-phosphate synthase [Phycisphaerae bacterium]MDG1137311.1 3,4-dihydroxy-2-butanone-4-phosphate synthase [Phycisphaerales bacterium]